MSATPYIFGRGSLKMTYELIRKKNPQLGLSLLNIMGSPPLPKDAGQSDNKHSDQFKVTLDSFQVRAVVEILMDTNQAGLEANNSGVAGMSKALIEDWMTLARQMISELPPEQQP